MVGPSKHGHGKTFGSNNGGKMTKGVIKFRILRHPGSEKDTSITL